MRIFAIILILALIVAVIAEAYVILDLLGKVYDAKNQIYDLEPLEPVDCESWEATDENS
jgi:hypothetical protein